MSTLIREHDEGIARHTPIVSLPIQYHRSHHKWDTATPQRVTVRVNEPNKCKVPTLALGI